MISIFRSMMLSLLAAVMVAQSLIAPTPALAQARTATAGLPAECRGVLSDARRAGHQFYRGASGPTEIAQAVEASLRTDSTGNTVLRPVDVSDRAWATPLQLFCALKVADPNAQNLRMLSDLPAYLRSLSATPPADQTRVWSACVTADGVRMQCELRSPAAGEQVWVNPDTSKIVFLSRCTNPVMGPERQPDCYVFSFDYRETRNVQWFTSPAGQRDALVSFHTTLNMEQVARMYADTCYFVSDGYGQRKPVSDCPELFCPPGSTWPTVQLANAVGLPTGERPPSSVHFSLQNGQGILSVPRWAAQEMGWVVPCVRTTLYPVGVSGWEGYQAVARFDVAMSGEIRPSIPSSRFPRTFTGATAY